MVLLCIGTVEERGGMECCVDVCSQVPFKSFVFPSLSLLHLSVSVSVSLSLSFSTPYYLLTPSLSFLSPPPPPSPHIPHTHRQWTRCFLSTPKRSMPAKSTKVTSSRFTTWKKAATQKYPQKRPATRKWSATDTSSNWTFNFTSQRRNSFTRQNTFIYQRTPLSCATPPTSNGERAPQSMSILSSLVSIHCIYSTIFSYLCIHTCTCSCTITITSVSAC